MLVKVILPTSSDSHLYIFLGEKQKYKAEMESTKYVNNIPYNEYLQLHDSILVYMDKEERK